MKVCIFDEGFIPGLGRGPFRTPIEVSEDNYALYKRMGLKVINASKTVSIAESGIKNRRSVKKETPIEEFILKNSVVKEVVETPIPVVEEIPEVEEVKEETPVVEEVKEETPVVEETIEEPATEAEEIKEETEVDINTLTKKELIELLTENGVSCNNNMTKPQLIKLVETNL